MVRLIDYDMGNLGSVGNALDRLGVPFATIGDGSELQYARCALLPGVGNFGDGMRNLAARGFVPAIKDFLARGGWLIGICLGMQMLLESSEESPGVRGLGVFPGAVQRFDPQVSKIPQIGWNQAQFVPDCLLAQGLPEGPYFYFVHSYFVAAGRPETAATAFYQREFSACLAEGRCFATQLHPEKSQDCGLRLLANFFRAAGEL